MEYLADYEYVVNGIVKKCKSICFSEIFYRNNNTDKLPIESLKIKMYRKSYTDQHKLEFDKDEIYVQVDVTGHAEKIEKQYETDARTIETDLKENGYSVINGIYFEEDKAEIKKESEPALNEIAKYLKKNPGVLLYVIAHTDMVGKLDFKIALSKSRADAVVKALVSRYFIASDRVIADGVGPLSPVATNQNLEGRKKNERIELVLRSF